MARPLSAYQIDTLGAMYNDHSTLLGHSYEKLVRMAVNVDVTTLPALLKRGLVKPAHTAGWYFITQAGIAAID